MDELDSVSSECWAELLELFSGGEDEFFFGSATFDTTECRYMSEGQAKSVRHSGITLRQLLGPGSEAIVPGDDSEIPYIRQAAALLIWARRRLR